MAALLRTAFISIMLCGLTWLGYRQWLFDEQARTIADLQAINIEMEQQLAARQAMLERLSRTRRVAHLHITDQQIAPNGEIAHTTLQFIELDEKGAELGRQDFTVPGDVLYIDGWTVKFESDSIAQGDPLRGGTLLLLRRIYSDRMPPRDGFAIDTPGAIPPGYAASDIGHFERRIWQNFWEIATNAEMARRMGVRVAQGEAVYKPVRNGHTYELNLDAAGGMSLMPLPMDSPEALTKAGN